MLALADLPDSPAFLPRAVARTVVLLAPGLLAAINRLAVEASWSGTGHASIARAHGAHSPSWNTPSSESARATAVMACLSLAPRAPRLVWGGESDYSLARLVCKRSPSSASLPNSPRSGACLVSTAKRPIPGDSERLELL